MKIYLDKIEMNTTGELPKVSETAPDFALTDLQLQIVTLENYRNKNLILNVFPSIDTQVCASSVHEFNKQVTTLPNTTVLCISMDLPFTQRRFCQATKMEGVEILSDFRERKFGRDYGLTIKDGVLAGLLARAVIVLDSEHTIVYEELVRDINSEPNYSLAIKAVTENIS